MVRPAYSLKTHLDFLMIAFLKVYRNTENIDCTIYINIAILPLDENQKYLAGVITFYYLKLTSRMKFETRFAQN